MLPAKHGYGKKIVQYMSKEQKLFIWIIHYLFKINILRKLLWKWPSSVHVRLQNCACQSSGKFEEDLTVSQSHAPQIWQLNYTVLMLDMNGLMSFILSLELLVCLKGCSGCLSVSQRVNTHLDHQWVKDAKGWNFLK